MRNVILAMMVGLLMLSGSVVSAKEPVRNVTQKKQPNLAAAQKMVAQAYLKIEAAQKANEFDMGGHAQKAKDLLDQANQELKMATESANANK